MNRMTLIGNLLLFAAVMSACTNSDLDKVGEEKNSSDSDPQRENEDIVERQFYRPKIELTNDVKGDEVEIVMQYFSPANIELGPRVAEIFVKYTDNLRYLASEKGDALEKAAKQLMVQNLEEDNKLRLVILAMDNTNELDTGRLATLKFERSGSGESTVRILTDSPIFAPQEANEGLLVSDPLVF